MVLAYVASCFQGSLFDSSDAPGIDDDLWWSDQQPRQRLGPGVLDDQFEIRPEASRFRGALCCLEQGVCQNNLGYILTSMTNTALQLICQWIGQRGARCKIWVVAMMTQMHLALGVRLPVGSTTTCKSTVPTYAGKGDSIRDLRSQTFPLLLIQGQFCRNIYLILSSYSWNCLTLPSESAKFTVFNRSLPNLFSQRVKCKWSKKRG